MQGPGAKCRYFILEVLESQLRSVLMCITGRAKAVGLVSVGEGSMKSVLLIHKHVCKWYFLPYVSLELDKTDGYINMHVFYLVYLCLILSHPQAWYPKNPN